MQHNPRTPRDPLAEKSTGVDQPDLTRAADGENPLVDATTGSEGGGPQVGFGVQPATNVAFHQKEDSLKERPVIRDASARPSAEQGTSSLRVISTQVHGIMDYAMGVVLIGSPWLLQFYAGGAETVVPVLVGASVILYSMLTSYEWGVVPRLAMSTHLGLDFLGGLVLAMSPWMFGFASLVWLPHVIFGVGEMLGSLMTKTVPTHIPGRSTTHAM